MKIIELTQGKFCVVDNDDYDELMKNSWCIGNDGYACRGIRLENGKSRLVRLHRQILGLKLKDGKQVDHINKNKLDNQKENLRICTSSQNQHNRPINQNNTSGYKGVTWHKGSGKWHAQIMINKKNKYLGSFDSPETAYEVYCESAKLLHKEFASIK